MINFTGSTIAQRYQVGMLLGRGGMGDVYQVWDQERAVHLAMKVLHADLAEDKVFLRRFSREAETLSSLQHPHIVRFYGLEQENGLTFMLMDYVEGTTLRKQIFDSRGAFASSRILQVIRPVCSALHYAHQSGRVHCDIKPANIMIRSTGEVLLADFGIARLMESSTTATLAGAGTPAYMAPEQVLGKRPSPQTDVYALGIVLFEMATGGERPFTGERATIEGSTAEKVRWEQLELAPPSPREYNPDLPAGLEGVILTCLEKEPARRYAGALDLLQALEQVLAAPAPEQEVEGALDDPAAEQTAVTLPEFSGRRRTQVVALTLAVLILTALSAWFLFPGVTPMAAPSLQPSVTQLSLPVEMVDSAGVSMKLVPAGEFTMGSDSGWEDERPVHQVYLDAFYMDVYEVTNVLYQACVQAGACTPPSSSGSARRSEYYDHRAYAGHPVIKVDWHQAAAYCAWRAARLPSEAEWEKAARGTDGRTYPWGEGIDCKKANYGVCQRRDASAVGSYPEGISPYGIFDLGGNVLEWVADWYGGNYYSASPARNPTGPGIGEARVLRGGAWDSAADQEMRAAARASLAPGISSLRTGFRCVRSAGP